MSKLEMAIEAARSGRTDEALGVFAELAEQGTGDAAAEALGHRAWLLKSLGRQDESLRDYERLLEIRPGDREAARQRCDVLRRIGRVGEALDGLTALLQSDPMDTAATRLLIEAQEASGAVSSPGIPPIPTGPPPPVRPLNPVLEILESDPNSYPTSSFPEVGRMLYSLTRCLRPALVVETGCYIGYSTLCIAQAMEDNGAGHLHSFDLFPAEYPYQSPVAGLCTDTFQAASAHIDRSGLAPRITLHRGDSAGNITRFFADQPALREAGTPVDLAFIDGDHTIAGCLRDFHAVDPLLKPGGVILLHDTVPDRCGWAGPRHLLDNLPEQSRGLYQCINLPSPEGFGLGILQKTGGDVVGRWRPSLRDQLSERLLIWRHWR